MSEEVKQFNSTLKEAGLYLLRGKTSVLQINTGLVCNQACKHCHLEAGPGKSELMSRKTIDEIRAFAARNKFATIDITGGAPEMNPELPYILETFKGTAPELIVRSNLSALYEAGDDFLMNCFKDAGVVITASFPSVNEKQSDAQRGNGIFNQSVAVLKQLNSMGYGVKGTDLTLNLVSNPSGAFMPAAQEQAEKRFRSVLLSKWGIQFSNLFSFANVPLGRYEKWLKHSENYSSYLAKLEAGFNPDAVKNLMCRTLMSVSWDGYVYDCDFNLAAGLHSGEKKTHITELSEPFAAGTEIANGNHCYACTAGAGFT